MQILDVEKVKRLIAEHNLKELIFSLSYNNEIVRLLNDEGQSELSLNAVYELAIALNVPLAQLPAKISK